MNSTQLYWVEGPWSGKLALAARPRGGEWLEDEMAAWSKAGVNTVLSLLTPSEESYLELGMERSEAANHGMRFISFPIEDRQVPTSPSELTKALERLDLELSSGRNAVVHCRQGVGRTGLVAACLLVNRGWGPQVAIDKVRSARGVSIPETEEQRRWIDYFAATLAGAQ